MTSLEYSHVPFIELPDDMAVKISSVEDSIGGRLKSKDISALEGLQSQTYDWINSSVYFVYKAVSDYIERTQHNLSRYEGEDKDELSRQLEELEATASMVLALIKPVQDGHFHLNRFIDKFKEETSNSVLKRFLQDESAQVVREKLQSLATLSSNCLHWVKKSYDEMKALQNRLNSIVVV